MPKKFVGESFSLSVISSIEKINASEGYVTIFRRNFFCLTVAKHFVEEPFSAVLQKIAENEKIYGNEFGRGEYRKFPSIIFCLKMPRYFVGEYFILSLISGVE